MNGLRRSQRGFCNNLGKASFNTDSFLNVSNVKMHTNSILLFNLNIQLFVFHIQTCIDRKAIDEYQWSSPNKNDVSKHNSGVCNPRKTKIALGHSPHKIILDYTTCPNIVLCNLHACEFPNIIPK